MIIFLIILYFFPKAKRRRRGIEVEPDTKGETSQTLVESIIKPAPGQLEPDIKVFSYFHRISIYS